MADNSQYIFQNVGRFKDNEVMARVEFTRGGSSLVIPVTQITDLSITESMSDVIWTGHVTFRDIGGLFTEKFNLVGQENVSITFGGDEDNRAEVKGIVYNVAHALKGSDFTLVDVDIVSPMGFNAAASPTVSFDGPLHDIVQQILSLMCPRGVRSLFEFVPTLNTGIFTNPGFRNIDFLHWLKSFAISTKGNGNYELFNTKFGQAYFVPRDYFNGRSVSDFAKFSEWAIESDVKQVIYASSFKPHLGFKRALGIERRDAVGFDYDRGKAILEEFEIGEIVKNKTFVGKYLPIPAIPTSIPMRTEYTGFRNENDVKGHVITRSEKQLDRMIQANLEVEGRVEIEPGMPIQLEMIPGNATEDQYDTYYSGKWIIEKVTHFISPIDGYVNFIDITKNAYEDVSDDLTLMKARNVNAT